MLQEPAVAAPLRQHYHNCGIATRCNGAFPALTTATPLSRTKNGCTTLANGLGMETLSIVPQSPPVPSPLHQSSPPTPTSPSFTPAVLYALLRLGIAYRRAMFFCGLPGGFGRFIDFVGLCGSLAGSRSAALAPRGPPQPPLT